MDQDLPPTAHFLGMLLAFNAPDVAYAWICLRNTKFDDSALPSCQLSLPQLRLELTPFSVAASITCAGDKIVSISGLVRYLWISCRWSETPRCVVQLFTHASRHQSPERFATDAKRSEVTADETRLM